MTSKPTHVDADYPRRLAERVARDMRRVLDESPDGQIENGLVDDLKDESRHRGARLRELHQWWRWVADIHGPEPLAPGLVALYKLFDRVWGQAYAQAESEEFKFAAFELIFGEPHGGDPSQL